MTLTGRVRSVSLCSPAAAADKELTDLMATSVSLLDLLAQRCPCYVVLLSAEDPIVVRLDRFLTTIDQSIHQSSSIRLYVFHACLAGVITRSISSKLPRAAAAASADRPHAVPGTREVSQ